MQNLPAVVIWVEGGWEEVRVVELGRRVGRSCLHGGWSIGNTELHSCASMARKAQDVCEEGCRTIGRVQWTIVRDRP